MYKFQYRCTDAYGIFENISAVEDRKYSFENPAMHRIETSNAFSMVYKVKHLKDYNIRFLPVKIREDIPVGQIALCFAKTVETSSKTMFTYWQNLKSCMHSKDSMDSFIEVSKSYRYEKEFLENLGVKFEIDRQLRSGAIDQLTWFCAEYGYKKVWNFVNSDEMAVFRDESIEPWQYLKAKYELWKKHPRLFWIRSKVHPGILLGIKRMCYSSSILSRPANFFYHKFVRKWKKIK